MSRLVTKAGDVPRRSLWQRIKDVALADVVVLATGGVKAGDLERLEELLLAADFGVPTTLALVAEIERLAKRGAVKTDEEFREALRAQIEAALRRGRSDPALVHSPVATTASNSDCALSGSPLHCPLAARNRTTVDVDAFEKSPALFRPSFAS